MEGSRLNSVVSTSKNSTQTTGSSLILLGATVLALGFCVWLAIQNRLLLGQVESHDGALSGPAQAVAGDLVPGFTPRSISGPAAQIQYKDGSACRLFLMFSPSCSACQIQERDWLPRLTAEAKASSIELLRLSIDDAKVEALPGGGRTQPPSPIMFFPEYALRRAYRVTAIPEVLLVAPTGRILWANYGVLNNERYLELKHAMPQCMTLETQQPASSRGYQANPVSR